MDARASPGPAGGEDEPDPARGFLVFAPSAVPREWRGRAQTVALVPLLPEEIDRLADGRAAPAPGWDEDRFLQLVARGLSHGEIAREMHVSQRTVERRYAELRRRLGATTPAEVAAALAGRGF